MQFNVGEVKMMSKGVSSVVILSIVVAAIVAAVVSAGLAAVLVPKPQLPPATEPPKERIIYMLAVEYKGSTEVGKLAPPEKDPKDIGPAYGFKLVDGEKWEVSAYAFAPSTIVVNQGDRVKLTIFGVNGDKHLIFVERYSEDVKTLNRGRFLDINFVANTPGMFQIVCSNHEPAMRGWLYVLPRVG